MNGFTYARAATLADAIGGTFIAGGTDLLQLWKIGAATPAALVDITSLPLAGITTSANGVLIGAVARLADVARHPAVPKLVTDAIMASASGQIRNMATVGGNLLQRTRCPYFRSADLPCNKRAPNSGCGAIAGQNRAAALFGASLACVASHPSDLAVALAALDAEIDIHGATGPRRLAIADFYRLPGDAPERDTMLAPGELITGIFIPTPTGRTIYLKIRDRASFEFAVLSVAVSLTVEAGIIIRARIVAGSVAPMPWRLHAVEAALIGRAPDAASFTAAAAVAAEGAQPLPHNNFKITLLRRAVARALGEAA